MCYHDDSYADTDAHQAAEDDEADASLEYTTTLTTRDGFTMPLSVVATREAGAAAYRVVLTPDIDPEAPKTFLVRRAQSEQNVRAFVDAVVQAFKNPYASEDLADRLFFELGLGSSTLTKVCRVWDATDLAA